MWGSLYPHLCSLCMFMRCVTIYFSYVAYRSLWGGSLHAKIFNLYRCMRCVKTLTAVKTIHIYEAHYYTHWYKTYTGLWGRAIVSYLWNLYIFMRWSVHSYLWNLYRFWRWVTTLTALELIQVYEAVSTLTAIYETCYYTHNYGTRTIV